MDINEMMQFMAAYEGYQQMRQKMQEKKEKKKEERSLEDRVKAIEERRTAEKEKLEKESDLLKRIEALEKETPRVNIDQPEPEGIDDIIRSYVSGFNFEEDK